MDKCLVSAGGKLQYNSGAALAAVTAIESTRRHSLMKIIRSGLFGGEL